MSGYDVISMGIRAGGAMANALRVGDHLLKRTGVQPKCEPTHVG